MVAAPVRGRGDRSHNARATRAQDSAITLAQARGTRPVEVDRLQRDERRERWPLQCGPQCVLVVWPFRWPARLALRHSLREDGRNLLPKLEQFRLGNLGLAGGIRSQGCLMRRCRCLSSLLLKICRSPGRANGAIPVALDERQLWSAQDVTCRCR